jgi:DNA-binding transcriptional LysR family regulator
VTDPDVVTDHLFDEDLILVTPLDHPLADADEVSIEDLAQHELLLPPPGTSIRVDLDRVAASHGVRLRPKAELDGIRLIASLTFEGFGAGVLPSTAVPRWLTGNFCQVPIRGLDRRQVGLARRRRGLPSAPTRAVMELIHQVVRDVAVEKTGLYPRGA